MQKREAGDLSSTSPYQKSGRTKCTNQSNSIIAYFTEKCNRNRRYSSRIMLRIASIFPWGVFATLSSPCTVIPEKTRRISTTPTPRRSHRGSLCRQRYGKRIKIEKPHVREQYPSSRHAHLPHASKSVAGGGSYIPPTPRIPLYKSSLRRRSRRPL